jgi:hypothetical protein
LNSGILIEQPIKNFNDIYFNAKNNPNLNLTVIFQEMYGSKKYIVESEQNMMFGELIIFFCLKSGIQINENMSFFFDNNEIPSYSFITLNQMNIGQNSIIYYMQQNKIMTNKIINVIFTFEGRKNNICANPYMLIRELILKFCQIIRYPYKEMISNYKFLLGGKNLLRNDFLTLKNIGITNCSVIDVVE